MLKCALLQMEHIFPKSVLLYGQDYHMQGHVLTLRLSDGLIRGRVKGSKGHIYDMYLDLKTWPKVPSRCSCQEKNCKHAVACLIALQDKESLGVYPGAATHRFDTSMMQPEIIDGDTLEWYSSSDAQGNAFFSYQLGILVDGESISIVPWVLEFIKRFDLRALDALPDDRVLSLPMGLKQSLQIKVGRIKPLIRLLLQYGFRKSKKQPDDVLLTRYQLLFMEEAERELSSVSQLWKGTAELRGTLQQLLNRDDRPDLELPIGLKATLREYQHQGLVWLQRLRTSGFGGVLADDMGLGKTIQTLAHFQYEKEAGRLQ
ncbi:MAG: SNF2-related protein, partial [Legionellaceae bacterium]